MFLRRLSGPRGFDGASPCKKTCLVSWAAEGRGDSIARAVLAGLDRMGYATFCTRIFVKGKKGILHLFVMSVIALG